MRLLLLAQPVYLGLLLLSDAAQASDKLLELGLAPPLLLSAAAGRGAVGSSGGPSQGCWGVAARPPLGGRRRRARGDDGGKGRHLGEAAPEPVRGLQRRLEVVAQLLDGRVAGQQAALRLGGGAARVCELVTQRRLDEVPALEDGRGGEASQSLQVAQVRL